MSTAYLLLLGATLAASANLGIQYYSQVSTYPLFADLAEGAFARYHKAYEARLPASVYAPLAIAQLAAVAAIFIRPAGIGPALPIVMAAAIFATAPISLLLAVPTHRRLVARGSADAPGMRRLLRANGLRVAVAMIAVVAGCTALVVAR